MADADHRRPFRQPVCDRRLASVRVRDRTLAHGVTAAGEDWLAPARGRPTVRGRPPAYLGVPGDRLTAATVLLTSVLQRDLVDDLHLPPVGGDHLEGAVDVAPADAAQSKDLIQRLDQELCVPRKPSGGPLR